MFVDIYWDTNLFCRMIDGNLQVLTLKNLLLTHNNSGQVLSIQSSKRERGREGNNFKISDKLVRLAIYTAEVDNKTIYYTCILKTIVHIIKVVWYYVHKYKYIQNVCIGDNVVLAPNLRRQLYTDLYVK